MTLNDMQVLLFLEFSIAQLLCNRFNYRVDEWMGKLVRAVYRHQYSAVPIRVKRLCLIVGKSFYYAAHCNNEEMGNHVDMVLFQPVYN